MIRHGSRSPKHTYRKVLYKLTSYHFIFISYSLIFHFHHSVSKDPYNNISFWEEGWGQLTREGEKTQFELGKFLRKRYDKLIGPDFSSKNIRFESTNEDRCFMSGIIMRI